MKDKNSMLLKVCDSLFGHGSKIAMMQPVYSDISKMNTFRDLGGNLKSFSCSAT